MRRGLRGSSENSIDACGTKSLCWNLQGIVGYIERNSWKLFLVNLTNLSNYSNLICSSTIDFFI